MGGFLRLSIFVGLFSHVWGASVTDLVGGMDAYQCYGKGGRVYVLDCVCGQSREVTSVSGEVGWCGGPNRDATKIVFTAGGGVHVVDWDGGNARRVASGDMPHFRETDRIVYTADGGTHQVRIDRSSNEPIESTRSRICDIECEAGLTGSGRYLCETYPRSFMVEVGSGTKSPYFNENQNCSGSPHPGNEVRMMFNASPMHDQMVIGEWDPADNTTRIVWSYGGSEIFGLWSVNHEDFCVMAEDESNFRLVRISDKLSAPIDMDGLYVGGPWVGNRADAHISGSGAMRNSRLSTPLQVTVSDRTFHISGLYPHKPCTVVLSDTRGKTFSVRRTTDSRGMVSCSVGARSAGVYLVDIRSPYQGPTARAVLP